MKKEVLMSLFCISLLLVMPLVLAASYSGETQLSFSTGDEDTVAADADEGTTDEDMTKQQQLIIGAIIVIVLLVILSYSLKGKNKGKKKK